MLGRLFSLHCFEPLFRVPCVFFLTPLQTGVKSEERRARVEAPLSISAKMETSVSWPRVPEACVHGEGSLRYLNAVSYNAGTNTPIVLGGCRE